MLLQVSSRRGRWTRFREGPAGGWGLCGGGNGAALRDLGPALRQICGLPSMGDRCAHPRTPPHLPVTTVSLFLEPGGKDTGNLPLFPQSQPPAWFPGWFRKWPYPSLLGWHSQLRSRPERSQETTEGAKTGSRGHPGVRGRPGPAQPRVKAGIPPFSGRQSPPSLQVCEYAGIWGQAPSQRRASCLEGRAGMKAQWWETPGWAGQAWLRPGG